MRPVLEASADLLKRLQIEQLAPGKGSVFERRSFIIRFELFYESFFKNYPIDFHVCPGIRTRSLEYDSPVTSLAYNEPSLQRHQAVFL